MFGRPQVRDIKFNKVRDAQGGNLGTALIGILDHAKQQSRLGIVDVLAVNSFDCVDTCVLLLPFFPLSWSMV